MHLMNFFRKIEGKKLSLDNASYDIKNCYGKQIFAQKVIKKNFDTINFEGFKPLFDEIYRKL